MCITSTIQIHTRTFVNKRSCWTLNVQYNFPIPLYYWLQIRSKFTLPIFEGHEHRFVDFLVLYTIWNEYKGVWVILPIICQSKLIEKICNVLIMITLKYIVMISRTSWNGQLKCSVMRPTQCIHMYEFHLSTSYCYHQCVKYTNFSWTNFC